ncbi:MAG: hypothetical protein U1E65_25370 [Myxococcota bacterium]
MARILGRLLIVLALGGCSSPPALKLSADFADSSYATMVLHLSSSSRDEWYVIDHAHEDTGLDAVPITNLGEHDEVVVDALLYPETLAGLGLAGVGALRVRDSGDTLPSAEHVFETRVTYAGAGDWVSREPARFAYPRPDNYQSARCPRLRADIISLPGATQPVSAGFALANGHVRVYTGHYGGQPFESKAFDIDPAAGTAQEVASQALARIQSRGARVNAGIEDPDGSLWLAIAPPGRFTEVVHEVRGRLVATATMTSAQYIDWMAWAAPDPQSGKPTLLLEDDGGGLMRWVIGGPLTRVLPIHGGFACYSEPQINTDFSVTYFCGGITKVSDGFWITRPSGPLVHVSPTGTGSVAVQQPPTPGRLLSMAVTPRGRTVTMELVQSAATARVFELNRTFTQLAEFNTQQPTAVVADGESLLFAGVFGYLDRFRLDGTSDARCPSQDGLLGGLWPTQFLPLGPSRFLAIGTAPSLAQSTVVYLYPE